MALFRSTYDTGLRNPIFRAMGRVLWVASGGNWFVRNEIVGAVVRLRCECSVGWILIFFGGWEKSDEFAGILVFAGVFYDCGELYNLIVYFLVEILLGFQLDFSCYFACISKNAYLNFS